MIVGLSIGVLFSQLLKWWFFEAETSPFYSQRTISREEQERIDVLALHIDMVFRAIWVLALSPILFHHMKLGHFLLDGYEEYENEIILKEAEDRRKLLETGPNQFQYAQQQSYQVTPMVSVTPVVATTTTTVDNEYYVRERTSTGAEIPVKIHTTTTKTTQSFPVNTTIGAVVRQRVTRSQRE